MTAVQAQDTRAPTRVSDDTLRTYVCEVMRAYGTDEIQARCVTDNLIWNDLIGRYNHGSSRLPILMKRVKKGLIKSPCQPTFTGCAPAAERLDGDGGFGQYAGELAMARAIELARANGIGIVGVHNSNFFGTGAFFVNQAADAGMISISLSNSTPVVAAHGGTKAVLGTNPFAFGVPRADGRHLILDMATSALAGSTVRQSLQSGATLPTGSFVSGDGKTSNAETKAPASRVLLPFGGAKGFGLSLLVEILSAVVTGAGISHGVASLYNNFERSGDNGHFMLAMDVRGWMPLELFEDRMATLVDAVQASGEVGDVQIPGENRWRIYEENRSCGIPLPAETRKALSELSCSVRIPAPWNDE